MALKVYNIKTDFSAAGNGQKVTDAVSISSTINPTHLSATISPWVLGDVGKKISVPGAGAAGGILQSSIASFTDANHVVLNDPALTTLSGSSQTIEFGTDDAPKFESFNTAARAWQTANPGDTFELDIPAGRFEFATQTGISQYFTAGLKVLTVVGAGPLNTFLSNCGFPTGGLGGFELGAQDGLYSTNPATGTVSSRVQTVAAGSTSVPLVNLSELSNWIVGSRGMMAGVDLADFGDPQTPAFWEYVRVTGTANVSGVGVVTFASPLKNTYKSTWPLYNAGDPSSRDQGGPATLFQLTTDSDIQQVFQDLTIDQSNLQTRLIGRDMTLTRVTVTGSAGLICSQQDTLTFNNVSQLNASLEMDKCCGTVTMNNCVLHQLDFQAQCANVLNMNNCTVDQSIAGSAVVMNLTNTSIAGGFRPGPHSYGAAQSLTCSGCAIATLQSTGGVTNTVDTVNWTITGGVIKVPAAQKAMPWAVPGAHCFFSGQYDNEGMPFTILDLWQDASFTYIATSLTITGWPSLPLTSGNLILRVHPAPIATFAGCTGDPQVVDLSQAGSAGKPLFSYSKRAYDNSFNGASVAQEIWGKIVSFTVDVTTTYAGSNSGLLHAAGQFDNYPTLKSDGTLYNFGPVINLKVFGKRVIKPPSAGGTSGAQSGDTLPSLTEAVWFTQGLSVFIGSALNDAGPVAFTVEIQTDQGFTTTATSQSSQPPQRGNRGHIHFQNSWVSGH